jgi:hypothetical protein
VLFGLHMFLADMLVAGASRYIALLVLVGVGIAAYFGTGFAIGALDWADFRSALRRKRATPAP